MSLPVIRKHVLFSLEGKNFSLTELRGSVYHGIEIISIEPFFPKPTPTAKLDHVFNRHGIVRERWTNDPNVHNTKLVLKVDTWKILDEWQHREERFVERICFYNRLDLNDIIDVNTRIQRREIDYVMGKLNEQGYDFTEDDLEFRDLVLSAKETSLGYIGQLFDNPYYDAYRLISEDGLTGIMSEDNTRILIEESLNA